MPPSISSWKPRLWPWFPYSVSTLSPTLVNYVVALFLLNRANIANHVPEDTLEFPSGSPHWLDLKVVVSALLLRNLGGLCSGIRLIIKWNIVVLTLVVKRSHHQLKQNVIQAVDTVHISQIPITPLDETLTFKSLQILLKVVFAMTIKKLQAQNLRLLACT